ncbi:MAG: GDP-mannose 4,6-dehydratase [Mobilitalea sp.]
MKHALITGITGQDGSYLAEYLLNNGYKVFGIVRRSSTTNFNRIEHILEDIEILNADVLDQNSLMLAMEKSEPDEIYNLAAQSFVPASWDQPVLTGEFTALGVTRVLEAVKRVCPSAHFYQASSSEMFGKVLEVPQTENTPFYPRSPYGVAKVYGHWITINYRESYNLFACSGILFNHESPRRGLEFVTRKITHGAANIKFGFSDHLEIGNLSSKRDWGFAGDYVRAMHSMLNQSEPDDYVIASGETHEVREFCNISFKAAGYNIVWNGKGFEEKGYDSETGKLLISVNKKWYRPAEVELLIGNPAKAKKQLGWEPKVNFETLVSMMVENDIKQVRHLNG